LREGARVESAPERKRKEMAVYALVAAVSNAVSSTLPSMTLMASSSKRVKLFLLVISSDAAPNDASVRYDVQRCTSAGTPGGTVTPQQTDPADGAVIATCGIATFSVGPTLTAGAFLFRGTSNLRSSLTFQAGEGYELIVPAVAANGLALLPAVVNNGPYQNDFTVHFKE